MSGYIEYLSYENGKYLTKAQLKFATNYVCDYLNNPTVNHRYYYDIYCYISKSFIICRWKKEHGYKPYAKIGEAICKDVLVNFLKEKEHKQYMCSSVYYNAVF